MNISLVLTAAGNSTRMKTSIKKEFMPIEQDETVLAASALAFLRYFQNHTEHRLQSCVVTLPKKQIYQGMTSFFNEKTLDACIALKLSPEFIIGGKTRQESVYKGLLKLSQYATKPDIVLIHDAARPFVDEKIIHDIITKTIAHDAAVPVIASVDTQKKLEKEKQYIEKHLERETLVSVQTPQGFSYKAIFEAHKKAKQSNKDYTDDSEIFSDYTNKAVFVVNGNNKNIKITYQSDIPGNLENKGFGTT
ncbi:MAG: IspD/TarI family cytidylyltransferase [Spirochaetota bacterium]|jgi:2-C-methyl-D-erythritol 4-phosphate cytidylyltransferase|nr:IspD/TarI family cytidylyltransferase [Spirochaetota bacterium]NMA56089.1 2-C-methyl-D-erythritol 4-phosphate cytidylyltransferase [Treponema sp.]